MNLLDLPKECIAAVISFTSPHDACRISAVSKLLKSAADSDPAWERFLHEEHRLFIDRSSSSRFSKKQLFLHSPLLIDDGRMSFWMEKRSGKKCFMLSARKLEITWADSPDIWSWISIPDSRFEEVAALGMICSLEIRGKISTSLLSKGTSYEAYLLFKEKETGAFGFQNQPVKTSFGSTRNSLLPNNRQECLVHTYKSPRPPREDGWLEIKLGEYYVGFDEEEEELEMSMLEISYCDWKGGIIVQGIEIRPKAEIF
ncbi:hypothetical protein EUTSA_v10004797mg [Eutrema salsugineum]|uniref:F-box domain-containing protein n=1 Tax=Eutrema salsugineum TaxID=72664 RepID=V4MKT0_EUTSA|nr:putative F-box protein PP2-B12 [Eutrema salsugineum]ESQ31996.1 hypothetical protein EUTSA_v10004797mg [Eutrema salsugineum]